MSPPSERSDRERLKTILVERSLELGDFTLSSGERSSYYIDARRTTMSAEGQNLLGRMALEEIRRVGLDPRAVGGLTLGADPVAYAVAHESWDTGVPIEAFTVRKEPKSHGTRRRIEGLTPQGLPVVVVEDVLTTGTSTLEAARAVEGEGGTVVGFLVVVDREAGGRARLAARGLPVLVLFRVSELLEAATLDPPGDP